jgi:uncharacterized protein YigE (DUF2233 family)
MTPTPQPEPKAGSLAGSRWRLAALRRVALVVAVLGLGLGTLAQALAGEAKRIAEHDAYVVDLDQDDLHFFLKDSDGNHLRSFGRLRQWLESSGKTLLFATNGGIYMENRDPLGLYVESGKTLRPLNTRATGYGNFYMQPNGVFLITGEGAAILRTERFGQSPLREKMQFATQSGPILIEDGTINPSFNPESTSRTIRNAVCILTPRRIALVISRSVVSFHEFATTLRDGFACRQALYLDGSISDMYLPEAGRQPTGGAFGPFIAVIR